MKTIKSEFIGTDATGKDFFRVIIVSESAPDSFPTSGADVDGVPDTAGIAAGSVLLTPDGNSVLYTDGWSEGGGGGDLVSITITPDLNWDGRTLASYFPITYSEDNNEFNVFLNTTDKLTEGDEYIFTVTPGADWYVMGDDLVAIGGKGEPQTFTSEVVVDGGDRLVVMSAAVCSAADFNEDPEAKLIIFSLTIVGNAEA